MAPRELCQSQLLRIAGAATVQVKKPVPLFRPDRRRVIGLVVDDCTSIPSRFATSRTLASEG